jgi:hypothetical protein
MEERGSIGRFVWTSRRVCHWDIVESVHSGEMCACLPISGGCSTVFVEYDMVSTAVCSLRYSVHMYVLVSPVFIYYEIRLTARHLLAWSWLMGQDSAGGHKINHFALDCLP